MSEVPEFLDQEPVFENDPVGVDAMPWHQVWIKAVTKPSVQTFKEIAALPNAKASTAYFWVLLTYLLVFLIVVIGQVTVGIPMMEEQFSQLGTGAFPMEEMGTSFLGLLCFAPFAAGFAVLAFIIGTALIQWVAKLFEGTGSYDKLVYPFGAIMAPYMLLSGVIGVLSLIPYIGACFGIFSLGIWVYQIVLKVLAVQAVNDLDTGKAVGAVILPGLAVFLFICCCMVLIFAVAGASMGEMLGQMNF